MTIGALLPHFWTNHDQTRQTHVHSSWLTFPRWIVKHSQTTIAYHSSWLNLNHVQIHPDVCWLNHHVFIIFHGQNPTFPWKKWCLHCIHRRQQGTRSGITSRTACGWWNLEFLPSKIWGFHHEKSEVDHQILGVNPDNPYVCCGF